MNDEANERIRTKVICVFRMGNRILVQRVVDPKNGQVVHVPPGGGVELGEDTEMALHREIREELGAEIEKVILLGVIENRFTFAERPAYEIAFIYSAQFVDRSLYEVEDFTITECDGSKCEAVWIDLTDPGSHFPPLCPDGLSELLEKRPNQSVQPMPGSVTPRATE